MNTSAVPRIGKQSFQPHLLNDCSYKFGSLGKDLPQTPICVPIGFSIEQAKALQALLETSGRRDFSSWEEIERFLHSDDVLLWRTIFKPLAGDSLPTVLANLLLIASNAGIEKLYASADRNLWCQAVRTVIFKRDWARVDAIVQAMESSEEVANALVRCPYPLDDQAVQWLYRKGLLSDVLKPWTAKPAPAVDRLRRWHSLEDSTLSESMFECCLQAQPDLSLTNMATQQRSFLELCLHNGFRNILSTRHQNIIAKPRDIETLFEMGFKDDKPVLVSYLFEIGARFDDRVPFPYLLPALKSNNSKLLQHVLERVTPNREDTYCHADPQPSLCYALEKGLDGSVALMLDYDIDLLDSSIAYTDIFHSAIQNLGACGLDILLEKRGGALTSNIIQDVVKTIWTQVNISWRRRVELWTMLHNTCRNNNIDIWGGAKPGFLAELLPMIAPNILESPNWQLMLQLLPPEAFAEKPRQLACVRVAKSLVRNRAELGGRLSIERSAEVLLTLLPLRPESLQTILEGLDFEDGLWDLIVECGNFEFVSACAQIGIPATPSSNPLTRAITRGWWDAADYILQNIPLTADMYSCVLDTLLKTQYKAQISTGGARLQSSQTRGKELLSALLPLCNNLSGSVDGMTRVSLIWRILEPADRSLWLAALLSPGEAVESDGSGNSLVTNIVFDLIYTDQEPLLLNTLNATAGLWNLRCPHHGISIMGQIIQAVRTRGPLTTQQELTLVRVFDQWKNAVAIDDRHQLLHNPIGGHVAEYWTELGSPRLYEAILIAKAQED